MAKDYASSVLKYLLLQLVFLSQQHADSASIVKFLPGYGDEGPLPFELETGFVISSFQQTYPLRF